MRSEKVTWILSATDFPDWVPFLSDVTVFFNNSPIFCEVIVFGSIDSLVLLSARHSISKNVAILLTESLESALNQTCLSNLCLVFFPSPSDKNILRPFFDKVFTIVIHRDLSFGYHGQDADLAFNEHIIKNREYSLRSFVSVVCHDFLGLCKKNNKVFCKILFEKESDVNESLLSSVLLNNNGTGHWEAVVLDQKQQVSDQKKSLRECDVFIPYSKDNSYWLEYAVINKKVVFDKISNTILKEEDLVVDLFERYSTKSVQSIVTNVLLRNSIHAHANCWKC